MKMEENLISLEDLTPEVGEQLIKLARYAIRRSLGLPGKQIQTSPILERKGMAFVTLEKNDIYKSLRGCIGYVEAIASLKDIVMRAAESAAFSDPRFPPVSKDEVDDLIIEVTVLTKPVKINCERSELPKQIKIGVDGLIVQKGITFSGLLLPQVPVEYNWDAETFLAETCIKASLEPDCWLDDSVVIKRFSGRIFKEKSPNGEVEQVNLNNFINN